MHDLTSAIERLHTEHSVQLQHVQSGAVQQFTGLDNKTRSLADELKAALQSVRLSEQGERDKLEARLLTQLERTTSHSNTRMVTFILTACNFHQLVSGNSLNCNTLSWEVVTIALSCGIPGGRFRVTKDLTHGSGHDRKPISLGTTVPRPIDFSYQFPLHVLSLK